MSTDYQNTCVALYRKARLLNDRQWDAWLECYARGVTYWMPVWNDDDQLTDDPYSRISLMYCVSRCGLEDRIFRIKTERSDAFTPKSRASHTVINMEVLAEHGDEVDVRYNFHTLSHRYKTTDRFFGTMFVVLRRVDGSLLIASKEIVLKNNYIRQVLDVYHI